jgi:hypothetical protein
MRLPSLAFRKGFPCQPLLLTQSNRRHSVAFTYTPRTPGHDGVKSSSAYMSARRTCGRQERTASSSPSRGRDDRVQRRALPHSIMLASSSPFPYILAFLAIMQLCERHSHERRIPVQGWNEARYSLAAGWPRTRSLSTSVSYEKSKNK